MKIVGFVGPKGSGKDTSFDLLKDMKRVDGKISFAGPLKKICEEVFELHFNLLNDPVLKEKELATPIRCTAKHIRRIRDLCEEYVEPVTKDGRILYRSNAISVIGIEGREFKTPRELMQIIGTDLIRDRVFKSWHKMAAFSDKALNARRPIGEGKTAPVYKQDGTYAVTDVRFLDEHEFLTSKFGSAYKAYYVSRPEADEKLATATHQSELETQKIKELLKDSVIDNSGSLDDLKKVLKGLDFSALADPTVEGSTGKKSKFKFVEKG